MNFITSFFSFFNPRQIKILIVVVVFMLELMSIAIGIGILFFLIIGYVYYNYKKELANIGTVFKEVFRNDRMFTNYGVPIRNNVFSLPVKEEWGKDQIVHFINDANTYIENAVASTYGSNESFHKITKLDVTELVSPNETRKFLKMTFMGSRGAIFTNFISFNKIGKAVSLHFYTYFRGIVQWWDMAFFLVFSPFTIWFWVIAWSRGEYKIYSAMAHGIENSFEEQDIRAYAVGSNEKIMYSLRDFLESKELLSKELLSIITNNITNINSGNVNTGNQVIGGANNSISQIK